nr:autophagy protein 12-like [Leptinotarsa decemlineata]
MSSENIKECEETGDSLPSLAVDLPNESPDSDEQSKTKEKQKYDILLKPTGNAPIMKKKKWAVDGDQKIGWIIQFVKKYIRLEQNEKLFIYVNQTFAPSPDQTVKNLFECYSTEGKLVLHYCKTQAWG